MGRRVVRGAAVSEEMNRRARELRRRMTPAEHVFWAAVRNRQLPGLRFRRQQVIGAFIIDFYCPMLRLAVELDGGVHERQRAYDAERDAWLRAQGVEVLRFTNEEVFASVERVLEIIFSVRG